MTHEILPSEDSSNYAEIERGCTLFRRALPNPRGLLPYLHYSYLDVNIAASTVDLINTQGRILTGLNDRPYMYFSDNSTAKLEVSTLRTALGYKLSASNSFLNSPQAKEMNFIRYSWNLINELRNNSIFPGEPQVASFCLINGTQDQIGDTNYIVEAMYPNGIPIERSESIISDNPYNARWLESENTTLEIIFNTNSPLAPHIQYWRRLDSTEDKLGTVTLFGRMPMKHTGTGGHRVKMEHPVSIIPSVSW